jgi:hypothetical protein
MDLPIASRSRPWDAAAATARMRAAAGGPSKDNMDWAKYGRGFLYVDPDNKEDFAGYKLPYCDVISGKLTAIPRAVFSVAAVLRGAMGGVSIPAPEKAKCRSVVGKWYAAFRDEFKDDNLIAPWEASAADVIDSIAESMFHATTVLSAEGRMLSSKNLRDIETVVQLLNELVQRARKYQGHQIELDESGVYLLSDDRLSGMVLSIDGGRFSLEAG